MEYSTALGSNAAETCVREHALCLMVAVGTDIDDTVLRSAMGTLADSALLHDHAE